MKQKLKGWKEGVLLEDLRGFGHTHKKGDVVRYKRYKNNGFTKYQYHVLDQNNYNLLRTSTLKIEGENLIDYWEKYQKGKSNATE